MKNEILDLLSCVKMPNTIEFKPKPNSHINDADFSSTVVFDIISNPERSKRQILIEKKGYPIQDTFIFKFV